MIVSCLYLRLSGSLARSWRSRRTATSDQNQSRTPGHRQCRTIDGASPVPPDGPLLQREAQEVQGRDPPDRLRDGSLHLVWRHLGAPRGRREALGSGHPATAYMAARASEHLTAGPTRPAESQSPSDPALRPLLTREAPEQREPSRLLTDIDWTPGASSDSPETDGRPLGSSPKATRKPSKAAPPIPGDPRTETPAQPAQPQRRSRCACNDRTTHISRRTRRAILTPASRAEN